MTKTRRKSPKSASRSEVAGSALVAALLGAQFAEEAAAAVDDVNKSREDYWVLRNARFCRGHSEIASDDSVAHAAHVESGSQSVGDHSSHTATAGLRAFSSLVADADLARSPSALFDSPRGRVVNRNTIDDHDGHATATSPTVNDDHDDHTAGPVVVGGGQVDAPVDHTTHTGGGTPTTPSTDPTSGGGHTHATTTTGGSTGATNIPHPNDPAKQHEHMAAMNLVPVSSATHVAVNNGSWFDPNTWANGQVPGDGARVVIPQGVTVDYDGKSPASIFTVRVDGDLIFDSHTDTFMEVDTFVVTGTGKLTIGTETDPVDPNVSAVISFADNGPIDVAWDPLLLSRGLISHGTVDIHGAQKDTFLKVSVDPMHGDNTLTLETVPSGWQVGDKLVLTGTHLASIKGTAKGAPVTAQTQDEELIIKAINGNVITLDRALAYDHEGPRADLKAYVANYSRNVVFQSENGQATPVHERGHVMMMHSDDVVVKYAAFDELGRTDKSARSFDVSQLTSVTSDSNVQGRYSFHLHRTGVTDQAHPAIVEGNAVWGSPGWGFVHHDSNAILSNNAAYDVFGAAFVAETGNETGRWDHNIAIKSLGMNHSSKVVDVGPFDLGRTGTGFWFQGRLVEAVDNVAAGVPAGAGFTYFHRGTDPNNLSVDPSVSGMSDSLRYLSGVNSNMPNISIFLNNETIASQIGLEVVKANPRQDHDVRSLIDDFTAWEVLKGVHLGYTGHYTIRNLDVVGTDSAGIPLQNGAGISLGVHVFDVVVNGANIEGFSTGVYQHKTAVNGLSFMNALDRWDYVYIDVNITGATQNYSNVTANDRHLTAADLTAGRLSYSSSYAETHITQKNGVFDLQGVKTDSIGKTAGYEAWDPDLITTKELRGAIEQNGFWTTADGRRVALIEEYYADRATADVIKVGIFVEIPSSYVLSAGRFTSITPAYNGVLNQNSKAPTAVNDIANVKQGHSVVIDVLANDKDPDGDKIHLDGIFSQSSHVVDNGDGTVTYFADPNFKGQDVFYYFVQDTNGDISKAQVTVTVDV
ncbi:MAG: cadherin-like domain-containing protein [Parvularculaceae bacterium]|nr:cadherin-like domain-containing protein [Parvularculaceae bacterium]